MIQSRIRCLELDLRVQRTIRFGSHVYKNLPQFMCATVKMLMKNTITRATMRCVHGLTPDMRQNLCGKVFFQEVLCSYFCCFVRKVTIKLKTEKISYASQAESADMT